MVKERLRFSAGCPPPVKGVRALPAIGQGASGTIAGEIAEDVKIRRTIAWEAAARGLALGPVELWREMGGGRANRVWRTEAAGRGVIVKHVREHRASSLFPNEAAVEAGVLAHLGPAGLAPKLLASWRGEAGPVLVMAAVPGKPLSRGERAIKAAAATLSRLWRQKPLPDLRRRTGGSEEILAEAHGFLAAWARVAPAEGLRRIALERLAPPGSLPPSPRLAFLHGDPVPANMIASPRRGSSRGVVLIDWQCAAAGDPVEDVALFLSPAMQRLYGDGPLSRAEEARFLAALPEDVSRRYGRAAPFHAFRMAAYCGWRAALGETDYEAGLRLEQSRLAALSGRT